MVWLALALLAAVALAPLALTLRRASAERGRREAALALHKAQLAELDRDRAEARIAPDEHAVAVLEVQRRLLAAAEAREPAPAGASRAPLLAALVMVPVTALALYLVAGNPGMPAMPLAERRAEAGARAEQEAALIGMLRERLSQLDPATEQARQGFVLLGGAEAGRGNLGAAAAAWRTALAARFDPALAAQTAEAITRASGRVTEEAAQLFRRALAEAPADAPWRQIVEKRLAQPQ